MSKKGKKHLADELYQLYQLITNDAILVANQLCKKLIIFFRYVQGMLSEFNLNFKV